MTKTEETTAMTTKTSAAAVSAALRRAGFNPLGSGTSRMREGLRVSTSVWPGSVRVSADLDSENAAERMAAEAQTALAEAGYQVKPADSRSSFYVSRSV